MVQQGFYVGERDWWVMAFYDIRTKSDLNEVFRTLLAAGCPIEKAHKACMELSKWNSGYTFSNLEDHVSVMCIGKATKAEQLFDTMVHELKHLTEHISDYYGLDSTGETPAYLQGEVGRIMFPAVALLTCPKCNK